MSTHTGSKREPKLGPTGQGAEAERAPQLGEQRDSAESEGRRASFDHSTSSSS